MNPLEFLYGTLYLFGCLYVIAEHAVSRGAARVREEWREWREERKRETRERGMFLV